MKKMKSSKGNAGLPKDHFEKGQGKLGRESKLKYTGSEMGNPEELDKRSAGLAGFVQKHKNKH